jgi:hypothetical protein
MSLCRCPGDHRCRSSRSSAAHGRAIFAGRAEAGPRRRWRSLGTVRVFSPWSLNVDPIAADMLTRRGWTMPPGDEYPTGRELVEQSRPWLHCRASRTRLGTRVSRTRGSIA